MDEHNFFKGSKIYEEMDSPNEESSKNHELYVLALQGLSIKEMARKRKMTPSAVKRFIRDTSNGVVWHWECARAKRFTAYMPTLDKLTNARQSQDEIEISKWNQTMKFVLANPRTETDPVNIARFIGTYTSARDYGEKVKIIDMAKESGISRSTASRIMRSLKLDPFYESPKRHHIASRKQEEIIERALNTTDLTYTDIANLAGVNRSTVERRARKKASEPERKRNLRVGKDRLLYTTVSALYALIDEGESYESAIKKIKETGGFHRRLTAESVKELVDSRNLYEPDITQVLRLVYDDNTLDKPYRASGVNSRRPTKSLESVA